MQFVVDKMLHNKYINNISEYNKFYLQNFSNKPYDVYYDPNIKEVVQCRPILKRLVKRCNELFLQWPDHPTLKQVFIDFYYI